MSPEPYTAATSWITALAAAGALVTVAVTALYARANGVKLGASAKPRPAPSCGR